MTFMTTRTRLVDLEPLEGGRLPVSVSFLGAEPLGLKTSLLYVGAGELNSGLYVCKASIFFTEPLPWPLEGVL